MSRNLRGGANKGFNFALGGDESSENSGEEDSKTFEPALSQFQKIRPKPPTFTGGKTELSLANGSREKQVRGLKLSLDDGQEQENSEQK